MNKKCFGIIALLIFVLLGGAYKFLYQGDVSESPDGRVAIHLSAVERNLILTEMRSFLSSVQQITKGISENNMKPVIEYSRMAGMTTQGDVPASLIGKLPLEFKQLGFDTHRKFDQLAIDAEDLGDNNHSLTQLSSLMQNCIACHAAYRIDISNKNPD